MTDLIGGIRRFHRDHTNRWIRRYRPRYADYLIHRGRRSAKSYETPIVLHVDRTQQRGGAAIPSVRAAGESGAEASHRGEAAAVWQGANRRVLIVATYGPQTDWLANVLAADEATVRTARMQSDPLLNTSAQAGKSPPGDMCCTLTAPRVLSRADAAARLPWWPRMFLRINRRAVVLEGLVSEAQHCAEHSAPRVDPPTD